MLVVDIASREEFAPANFAEEQQDFITLSFRAMEYLHAITHKSRTAFRLMFYLLGCINDENLIKLNETECRAYLRCGDSSYNRAVTILKAHRMIRFEGPYVRVNAHVCWNNKLHPKAVGAWLAPLRDMEREYAQIAS